MRDFNSYEGKKNKTENFNGNAMNLLNAFASRYEGASENDLISAIMLEAEKGRKNGTLTDKDIDAFAATISPMLNSAQREKLNSVVKKLKNQ